jgi:hypothetical protein
MITRKQKTTRPLVPVLFESEKLYKNEMTRLKGGTDPPVPPPPPPPIGR